MSPAPRRTAAALSLALALTACPGEGWEPEPEQPPAPGALTSLSGRFVPHEGVLPAQVRVALAWYPGLPWEADTALSAPGHVLSTREVWVPAGGYRLDVTAAPPATALGALPDGLQGRGATGVVLAYVDGNGNGQLDTIPVAGTPVDRVLGASLYGSSGLMLVYAEGEQPAGSGLQRGVNLVQLSTGSAVPASTPVPLELSGGALLDLLVCEGTWDGVSRAPCGLDLGEEPQEPQWPTMPVLDGQVTVHADRAEAQLRITVDGVAVEDATVTLDGLELVRDAASGHYVGSALPAQPFLDGEAAVQVVRPGSQTGTTLTVPGAFAHQGASRVETNQPVQARWTPAASAQSYDVTLVAQDGSTLAHAAGLDVTGHDLPSQPAPTTVTVQVAALRRNTFGSGQGRIDVRTVRSQVVTVVAPAPAGALKVEGTVVAQRYGTLTELRVKRGDQAAAAPRAFLGNTELTYDATRELFELVEPAIFGSMFDAGPVTLRVLDGDAELTRTLALPGTFQVTSHTSGAQVVRGAQLTATWTPSAGAQRYNASLVRLPDSGVLELATVTGTTHTFTGTGHTGGASLFVEAVREVEGGETLGAIQLRRYVEVPLSFVAP